VFLSVGHLRCLTDKFTKLECLIDKSESNDVFYTKPQMRGVPGNKKYKRDRESLLLTLVTPIETRGEFL
jgi:hypothetical protein